MDDEQLEPVARSWTITLTTVGPHDPGWTDAQVKGFIVDAITDNAGESSDGLNITVDVRRA